MGHDVRGGVESARSPRSRLDARSRTNLMWGAGFGFVHGIAVVGTTMLAG